MKMATRLRWGAVMGVLCGGVAACSGADLPTEATLGSDQELKDAPRCAGPQGLECATDRYCSSKPGKCPGEDRAGRCAVRPEVCTKEFVPVCGCDGVTYGNACEAAAAGTSVASAGECATEGAFCGGIAGIPCPEGQQCVDAPGDGCNPENGGADCGGICVAAPVDACASVRCKKGRECVVTPEGTAECVRTDTNPCAAVLCATGTECVVKGKRAHCVPSESAETCGEAVCAPGTACCNPLRSICTPPGVACIQ